jgi:arsenate reductase
MAEGLINHFRGDTWAAYSAGTEPSGYVHPMSIAVMADLGISLASNRSKSTDEFRDQPFDVVITVCDDAAEKCPVWLGSGNVVHIGFPDPAEFQGSDAEIRAEFSRVRDSIRDRVLAYLDQYIKSAAMINGGSDH